MKYFQKIICVAAAMALCLGTMQIVSAGNTNAGAPLVPLRFICEEQGAKVTWDESTSTATVKKGENTFDIKPGSKEARVNGEAVALDAAADFKNGRLTVPLELINDALETNITMEDCVKMLSVKYVDLLLSEAASDCLVLYNDYLSKSVKPDLIRQMGMGLAALGNIELQNTEVQNNSVHTNVILKYVSKQVGQFNYIVRFDNEGLIDDAMLLPGSLDMEYKAPEYDKQDSYTEKEVVIGEGEWKLPGTLTIPKGKGPFPVVVLVHGSGTNDRDETIGPVKPFRDIAVGLASKNIAVLRYEKRSLEHNLKFSQIQRITVKDETIDDALAAVEFLGNVPEIDATKIIVLGHSQGGMLVPRMIKGDKEGKIKAAIVMSGNTRPLGELICDQYKYLSGLNMAKKEHYEFFRNQVDMINSPEFSPENPPEGFVLGTPYWWYDIRHYNPAQDARDITKPLLILQGERDYQVTAAEDFKGWKDNLSNNDNVTFKLYAKLNHLYTEGEGKMSTPQEYYQQANIPSYVIDDMAQWIASLAK